MGLVVLIAGTAVADFGDPGTDPSESPRLNTPNDPEFDQCEEDDEDTPGERECLSYFNEQFGSFGFNPDSARDLDPTAPGGRTEYDDCSQLDSAGRAANQAAGDPECAQIAGVRADTAWKYSTGSPKTVVAILDTGIEWQSEELIEKVHLNVAELPRPKIDSSASAIAGQDDCAERKRGEDDTNGDDAVNVVDFACDPRVAIDAGDTESDDVLDGSDLIATFSDNDDDDENGYVDDIAGWDFFDDDNDPFDVSSCCSASGHGTGRAQEAASDTDNGIDATGMCPDCQIMPLRVWDTFVVDTNLYALGTVYAADNGADVVEGAVGGLINSNFARRSFTYADRKGVTLTLVSSDINSANHNYPTNYNEAIYVAGSLPDSAPSECGVGSLPGVGGPDLSIPGCSEFFAGLSGLTAGGFSSGTQPPTTSFFRNSNLTQYGGKADIVLMGATGSANTGQASGAAGLLESYGRKRFRRTRLPRSLSGNEIRQLLTMTAEDVLPANTGSIGLPDKANTGWDTHFGYGRVNLAGAMQRIQERRIPPEAQLDAPDWFAPINVDRVGSAGVPIDGRAAAPHSKAGVGRWEVEYACGQDANDSDFAAVPGASGRGETDGRLGRLPVSLLQQLADDCDGSVSNDAGRPAGRASDPFPTDPYPDPDPERHAFQIRLTVHEAGDAQNIGRYRKTLHAYRDDGTLKGWPRPLGSGSEPSKLVTGSGGETPTRLADLDGDNRLDVILGTSSGELHVLDSSGRPLESFNDGRPVLTKRYSAARSHDRPPGSLDDAPRESLRAPAIGDVTGDGEPELVATAGERLYAWHRDGRRVDGFPQRVKLSLSSPCVEGVEKPCFDAEDRQITTDNHIKRGFLGSPALADLDEDGRLDVVAGSLDQHVYAWDGRGKRLPGFPAKLSTPGDHPGAEIPTSPAVGDLDGDGDPEVVIATNEVLEGEFDEPPDVPTGIFDAFVQGGLGANVVYAIHGDGEMVDGWPVEIGTLAGDILPLVVPGNDAAVLDADDDPEDDEVAVSAATGDAKLVDGDGDELQVFQNEATASQNITDAGMQVNLADYPSVGELSDGAGPSVIKGGISLNGVVNLLAVNQNLPFNHSVQAWDPRTGSYRPSFPVATDDFQLVSQPAVAKVDGSGSDRQVLYGTGLYQLHAYGPTGLEPSGWPKFLGGWVQPTPSVGNIDRDPELEVTAVTREGWSFAWETSADACDAGGTDTNQEWWTFHHDEFSSANYRTDARPPARPGRLKLEKRRGGAVELSFAGSGDDLDCGEPARYEIRGSDDPIRDGSDFKRAKRLAAGDADPDGGRDRLIAEDAAKFNFIAVRAVDDGDSVGTTAKTLDDADNVSYVRSAAVRRGERGGGGREGNCGGRRCIGP